MLPSDPYTLKRSLGDDDYHLNKLKIDYGYNNQYARNNLQLNRGNNLFSEVGLYAGVYATDWSWAPLWMDFDNDGLKDLFISNGIPKRLNDMDYINFVSSEEIQQKLNENKMDENNMALVNKFPEIKIPNKFFKNNGNRTYENYPVRGFQSSMQLPLHIGLDKTNCDSVFLIWPDNTYQPVIIGDSSHLAFTYSKDLPRFDYTIFSSYFKSKIRPMEDITSSTSLNYKHVENLFNEFNREPLIPHMVSTEGPALAVAD